MMHPFCGKVTGCREKEIRKELKRRVTLLQRMKNDPSCPSSSYGFMELYISALKRALREK